MYWSSKSNGHRALRYVNTLTFSIIKAFRDRELSTHYFILDKFSNFAEDNFRFKIRMI